MNDIDCRLKEEHEWIAGCRAGDKSAFTKLYRGFAGQIRGSVILPRVGNPAVADELLLDTFRTVWERISTFEDRGKSIFFWIARIAINKIHDYRRKEQRGGRWIVDVREIWGDSTFDSVENALDLLQRQEIRGHVQETLQQINPRYRDAIRLRFFECKSREECAYELAVQLGTFDVLLLRALRAFREVWSARLKDQE